MLLENPRKWGNRGHECSVLGRSRASLTFPEDRVNVAGEQVEGLGQGESAVHAVNGGADDPAGVARTFPDWVKPLQRGALKGVRMAADLNRGTCSCLKQTQR